MFDNSFDILTALNNILHEIEYMAKTVNDIEDHFKDVENHLESIDDNIREIKKQNLKKDQDEDLE